MELIAAAAVLLLVVIYLAASIKIVSQGYQYTIEYFGRFTVSRGRDSISIPPSSIASGARST